MKIYFTQHFKRQVKKLKKKYPHVAEDLLSSLKQNELTNQIHVRDSVIKVRIPSRDQNKGKSGGFRCYIYLYTKRGFLFLSVFIQKAAKKTFLILNYRLISIEPLLS